MTQPKPRAYTSLEPEGEAAVGRAASWAAWLKSSLADIVSNLLDGAVEGGSIIASDMMASKLIELSRKLLKNEYTEIPLDLQEKTSDALTKASAALTQRNLILHRLVGGTFISGSTAFHDRKRPGNAYLQTAEELDLMGERRHASMEEIYGCSWEIRQRPRDSEIVGSGEAHGL